MQRHFENQHTDKTETVPDTVNIVFHARHKLARIIFIKKIGRKGLHIAKQIAADQRRYFRRIVIETEFLRILENSTAGTESKVAEQQLCKKFRPAADDNIIHDHTGKLRCKHIKTYTAYHADNACNV